MYRRPKFLEVLLEIRQKMSREADYDVDLFAEMVRGGKFSGDDDEFNLSDLPIGKKHLNRKAVRGRKSQI